MTAHDVPPLPDGLRALLDSANAGAPPVPPGLEQQVLGQLGATLGATGGVGATATTTSGSAASAGASAGLFIVVAKPLAVLVVAAAVGGGLYAASHRTVAPPNAPAPARMDDGTALPPGAAPHVERWAPSARLGEIETEPTRAADDAAAGTNDADESALLERARAALARGDNDTALAALTEHEQRFSRGLLVEERRALTVVAFAQRGDRERARAGAAQFERHHPDSIFLEMVQRSVGER